MKIGGFKSKIKSGRASFRKLGVWEIESSTLIWAIPKTKDVPSPWKIRK